MEGVMGKLGIFLLFLILVALGNGFRLLSKLKKLKEEEKGKRKKEIEKEKKLLSAEKEKGKIEKCSLADEEDKEEEEALEEEESKASVRGMFWWWLESLLIITIVSAAGVLLFSLVFKFGVLKCFSAWGITNIVLLVIFLSRAYNSVPEKENWTVELLGYWFNTWHSGPHFLIPFFSKISGKVYMGDRMMTLYMDDKERDGYKTTSIEFIDTSAGVVVRFYYYIFSAHRAVYNVYGVKEAIREKMDSCLRACLGKKKLDEALKARDKITLDSILSEEVNTRELFGHWGVRIRSLAITDIIISDKIIELRNKILTASKKRDAAKIDVKTAEHEANAEEIKQRVRGLAAGEEIKALMEQTGLSKEKALEYLLAQGYFKAIKDNKGVILSGKTDFSALGAELAAGSSTLGDVLKGGK